MLYAQGMSTPLRLLHSESCIGVVIPEVPSEVCETMDNGMEPDLQESQVKKHRAENLESDATWSQARMALYSEYLPF